MQPTVFYCLLTICMLAYKTFSNVTLCHVYTRPLFDEAASWGVSIFGFIRKNVCFSGAKDAIRPVILRAPLPKPHPIIPEKQKLYLKNLHGKLIIFFRLNQNYSVNYFKIVTIIHLPCCSIRVSQLRTWKLRKQIINDNGINFWLL